MFDPDSTKEMREKVQAEYETIPQPKTKEADYVWLPLRFDGDRVIIDWLDEWRIEDYD